MNKRSKEASLPLLLTLTALGLLVNGSLVNGQTPKSRVYERPADMERAIKPPQVTRHATVQAARNEVNPGESVRFTGRVDFTTDAALWFQFNFGDGAVSRWDTSPAADHAYSRAGTYQVYVTVKGYTSESSIKSGPVAVRVKAPKEPQPPPGISIGLDANRYRLYAGESVRFTATIRPSVRGAEYRFSFGDGAVSDWVGNPVVDHVYSRDGNYSVFVTARRLGGEFTGARLSSTLTQNSRSLVIQVIPVQNPPVQVSVSLEADKYRLRPGEAVKFSANISRPTREAAYQFYYGDGTDSGWVKQRAVDHVYSRPGTYRVYVVARGPTGEPVSSGPISIQVQKPAEPVSVGLGADRYRVSIGDPVRFTASLSPRFPDVEYQFNYGDGTPARWMGEPVADHVYRNEGSYQVNVTARSARRAFTVSSQAVTIRVQRPPEAASLTLEADRYRLQAGEAVRFRTSVNRFSQNAEYQFQFGDSPESPWQNQAQTDHVYRTEGSYNVTARARLGKNTPIVSNTVLIEVVPVQYGVSLKVDRDRVREGEGVKFAAHVNPAADVEYRFSFGDGDIGPWRAESRAEHVYSLPGWREAFVIVRKDGRTVARSQAKRIEITSIDYRAILETSKKDPLANENVRFDGSLAPGNRTAKFRFDFGDRSQTDWSDEPASIHSYRSPGTYGARLIAQIGDRTFESETISIEVAAFEVALTSKPQSPRRGQTVHFSARPGREVKGVEYRFVFGDGSTTEWADALQAEHAYTESGEYSAYLMARLAGVTIFESQPVMIGIAGFFPWRMWLGILGGMILAGAGGYYLSHINVKPPSAIQISPQPDIGSQTLASRVSYQPSLALRLRPVVDQGRQTIKTDASKLQLSQEVR